MAHIRQIADAEATGPLARIYKSAIDRVGKVFGILRVQSLNPPVLLASMQMYQACMFGPSPLSRAQREMLATVTSHANACHY